MKQLERARGISSRCRKRKHRWICYTELSSLGLTIGKATDIRTESWRSEHTGGPVTHLVLLQRVAACFMLRWVRSLFKKEEKNAAARSWELSNEPRSSNLKTGAFPGYITETRDHLDTRPHRKALVGVTTSQHLAADLLHTLGLVRKWMCFQRCLP
jgi:hypothetical protein